jgi:hypothetical protein
MILPEADLAAAILRRQFASLDGGAKILSPKSYLDLVFGTRHIFGAGTSLASGRGRRNSSLREVVV